jgi:hypothetical protein
MGLGSLQQRSWTVTVTNMPGNVLFITKCPIRPGPLDISIIWQNMEKCKEGKVVANHVFPISSVRILYLGGAVTALHSWHVRNIMLRRCCHGQGTRTTWHRISEGNHYILMCWYRNNGAVWPTVAKCCTSTKPHMPIEHPCPWQHHRNILLQTCQECSAVTASRRHKIRTLEIGNTWFATTFPSLHVFIFCQITEFSYVPGLTGNLADYVKAYGLWSLLWKNQKAGCIV